MCNCTQEMEQKLKEHLTENRSFKKPVKRVRSLGTALTLTTNSPLVERTKTDFEVTLEGQKKKEIVPIFHSYCPFCGEKFNTTQQE